MKNSPTYMAKTDSLEFILSPKMDDINFSACKNYKPNVIVLIVIKTTLTLGLLDMIPSVRPKITGLASFGEL
jgi:hypothetical protein